MRPVCFSVLNLSWWELITGSCCDFLENFPECVCPFPDSVLFFFLRQGNNHKTCSFHMLAPEADVTLISVCVGEGWDSHMVGGAPSAWAAFADLPVQQRAGKLSGSKWTPRYLHSHSQTNVKGNSALSRKDEGNCLEGHSTWGQALCPTLRVLTSCLVIDPSCCFSHKSLTGGEAP